MRENSIDVVTNIIYSKRNKIYILLSFHRLRKMSYMTSDKWDYEISRKKIKSNVKIYICFFPPKIIFFKSMKTLTFNWTIQVGSLMPTEKPTRMVVTQNISNVYKNDNKHWWSQKISFFWQILKVKKINLCEDSVWKPFKELDMFDDAFSTSITKFRTCN